MSDARAEGESAKSADQTREAAPSRPSDGGPHGAGQPLGLSRAALELQGTAGNQAVTGLLRRNRSRVSISRSVALPALAQLDAVAAHRQIDRVQRRPGEPSGNGASAGTAPDAGRGAASQRETQPHYSRADRRLASEGLKIARAGRLPTAGTAFIVWNFPPGEARAISAPTPERLMRLLVSEALALRTPIIGHRYPRRGEPAIQSRENPYAAKRIGVVRLEGVTDVVGGYGPEKSDFGLRIERARAVSALIDSRVPLPLRRPTYEISAAASGEYLHRGGGDDVNSRAHNRAVVVHIRPAIEGLTPEQTQSLIERDVRRRTSRAWPREMRELTRRRLRLDSLPGIEGVNQRRVRLVGPFVIDNFDRLMFTKGQDMLVPVRVPEPGKRAERPADLPDPAKSDDLDMIFACAMAIHQEEQEYRKLTAGSRLLWSVPVTGKEKSTAIIANRRQRETLVRWWRFYRGMRGEYAESKRQDIRREFAQLLKAFDDPNLRLPTWYPRAPTSLED